MSREHRQDSYIFGEILSISSRKPLQIDSNNNPIERYINLTSLTIKVCTLCLSTFYFGYCLVYLSTLSTNAMAHVFGLEAQQTSVQGLLFGILTLGGAVGAFVSPYLMKKYTRRYVLDQLRNLIILLNCGALVVEGMIQYPNIYCLFVCRFCQGFFMGNFIGLLPAYISQITPKELIGNYKVFNQLFFVLGILFAFLLGTILTKAGVHDRYIWRLMFGFNILMIVYLLSNCLFGIIPESPKSYIRKGLREQAKKVIGLFVKPQYIDEVFRQKLFQVNNELKGRVVNNQQVSSYSKKAYFIGFLLPMMQPLTGINAIITHIGSILQNHHFQFGYYVPLIICFVQFLAIFGSVYTSREFGRRTVILTGSLGLGICDVIIGFCFMYTDEFEGIFWIIFLILILYMIIYGLTMGPIVWMYIPEIIPASVVPFAAIMNCLSSTFCLMVSPIINASEGTSAVYFSFGVITLLVTIVNLFGMVESKGLNVQQVRKAYFGESTDTSNSNTEGK